MEVREEEEPITFTPADRGDIILPHNDPMVISAVIAKHPISRILVDSGSSVNLIYWNCFEQMHISQDRLRKVSSPLYSFTGEPVSVAGSVQLPVTLGADPQSVTRQANFMVVKAHSAAYNMILGRPLLNDMRAVVSSCYLLMKFPTLSGVGQVRGDQKKARSCYVSSTKGKRAEETLSIAEKAIHKSLEEETARKPQPVEELEAVRLSDIDPEKLVYVSTKLPKPVKEEIMGCLRENLDVFAWTPRDMPGISPDEICHHLNVDPQFKPVRQKKKRNIAPDRLPALKEEIDKLLKACFIREVLYPEWLANVVMVKKPNGKWRVCIDFIGLNKACPKDSYPLPRIDHLVDETSGYHLLSFLDAFSGYHQIMMYPPDQEKTSFIIEKGTYCYQVMLFGLKNARATYQRMVNKVFKELLGDTMEAYVDDMIVKSREKESHVKKLARVLEVFRQYKMRLNPAKCAFGVQSGKFLRYMITQRGIEANPEKIQAILDMEPPTSIKEVQRLTGRMAALGRFLSKSAERELSFLQTLRTGKKFEWTEQCQKSFEALKEYLKEVPLLTRPETGEMLYLYLGVSDKAVSAVLIKKEGQVDRPVYYVSKVLQGPETRYPFIEKVALALLNASRKLRPYFQAHSISVLTDQPLRSILQKPKCSGRLTKWSIELSEYDIQYHPRQAIKGQALADFIVECTPSKEAKEKSITEWLLFVDGAASSQGSGAGIVLIPPEGESLEYSLRFAFPSSNNVAEYEALIASLRLARKLEVAQLIAHSDSQLIVQQYYGQYETREPAMGQYLQKVRALAQLFESFRLVQINRSLNGHADALSKLASTKETTGRTVYVEVLQQPSIEEPEVACIENSNDWRTPFYKYLTTGELPADPKEAKKIKLRGARFTIIDGMLYKRAHTTPLLKCLGPRETNYALIEVHSGVYGEHLGGRALAAKILRAGFFWPTLQHDAQAKVKECDKCQRHAPIHSAPISQLQPTFQPIPFAQWGLDILGPFPQATGQRKFLLVAMDYFTKWIEAEALATISARKVEAMVWKDIVCRFGISRIINTDHGKQFDCDSFRNFCKGLDIQLRISSVAYPQANGQAEVSNRTILHGLKTRLEGAKGAWVDELPTVLWAYRTTSRVSTGETPFNLVYGTEALIPVEISCRSPRLDAFDKCDSSENSDSLKESLDLIEEQRDRAAVRIAAYHKRVANYYNSRVRSRPLKKGDLILRKSAITNALREDGKFRANWEGPYCIQEMIGPSTCILQTLQGETMGKTWSTNHLKLYSLSDM
ncbi:uncharacterized protein LOC127796919 [Diospyros lotus]|uniref:uncharacterized protein LOC127796919 n=1 Tax=Diospyros lotus TaxID=55363 RepID=UPI002259DBB0|nr:uncharacterized protein LOC127796919 [Diospyros lotus]